MARGNRGQALFLDQADRRVFLGLLRSQKAGSGLRVYAYCLMSNHLHLVLRIGAHPLSRVMQRLLTAFACYSNRKTGFDGHVFQGRYKAILCSRDSYLLALLRYVHMNPVKAGLCPRPELWPWSGHLEYIEPRKQAIVDVDWPLSLFASSRAQAISQYIAFLGQPAPAIKTADFDPGAASVHDEPLKAGEEAVQAPFPQVAAAIIRDFGMSEALLGDRSKRPASVCLRRRFIQEAARRGCRAVDIARFLGCSNDSVWQTLSRLSRMSGFGNVRSDP